MKDKTAGAKTLSSVLFKLNPANVATDQSLDESLQNDSRCEKDGSVDNSIKVMNRSINLVSPNPESMVNGIQQNGTDNVVVVPLDDDLTPVKVNGEITNGNQNKDESNDVPENVHCTACNKNLNIKRRKIYSHPKLETILCKVCLRYINSSTFSCDEMGIEEFCTWCGDGGDLVCCDFCEKAYCKHCVKRNLGKDFLKALLTTQNVKWKCFYCDKAQIKSLICECNNVLDYVKKQKLNDSITLKTGPSQSERRQRLSEVKKIVENSTYEPVKYKSSFPKYEDQSIKVVDQKEGYIEETKFSPKIVLEKTEISNVDNHVYSHNEKSKKENINILNNAECVRSNDSSIKSGDENENNETYARERSKRSKKSISYNERELTLNAKKNAEKEKAKQEKLGKEKIETKKAETKKNKKKRAITIELSDEDSESDEDIIIVSKSGKRKKISKSILLAAQAALEQQGKKDRNKCSKKAKKDRKSLSSFMKVSLKDKSSSSGSGSESEGSSDEKNIKEEQHSSSEESSIQSDKVNDKKTKPSKRNKLESQKMLKQQSGPKQNTSSSLYEDKDGDIIVNDGEKPGPSGFKPKRTLPKQRSTKRSLPKEKESSSSEDDEQTNKTLITYTPVRNTIEEGITSSESPNLINTPKVSLAKGNINEVTKVEEIPLANHSNGSISTAISEKKNQSELDRKSKEHSNSSKDGNQKKAMDISEIENIDKSKLDNDDSKIEHKEIINEIREDCNSESNSIKDKNKMNSHKCSIESESKDKADQHDNNDKDHQKNEEKPMQDNTEEVEPMESAENDIQLDVEKLKKKITESESSEMSICDEKYSDIEITNLKKKKANKSIEVEDVGNDDNGKENDDDFIKSQPVVVIDSNDVAKVLKGSNSETESIEERPLRRTSKRGKELQKSNSTELSSDSESKNESKKPVSNKKKQAKNKKNDNKSDSVNNSEISNSENENDKNKNENNSDSDSVAPTKRSLRNRQKKKTDKENKNDKKKNEVDSDSESAAPNERKLRSKKKKKSESENSEDKNDSGSDSEPELPIERKTRKRKKKGDADNDRLTKRSKRRRKLSSSSSENDMVNGKKKKVAPSESSSSSESDSVVSLKSVSESDSDKSITIIRKNKGKKKNAKKSTKKEKVNISDDDEDGDANTPSKQGRKKIRRILKDTELNEETRHARELEEKRRKRLLERTKADRQGIEHVLEIDEGEFVLEHNSKKEPLVSVHADINKHLKPHQRKGIQFMYDCTIETVKSYQKKEEGGGALLAHCMGLGKTLQVVSYLHTMKNNINIRMTKFLVVAPLNTVLNWENEFRKWLPVDERLDVFVLSYCNGSKERVKMLNEWYENGGVVITGYEMYRNLVNHKFIRSKKMKGEITSCLQDPGPDVVVCDEGHILRNSTSAISIAMNKIKTRRRIVLTGTPLQNNLPEYFVMVDFVKPKLLGTKKEFQNRFVNPIHNGQCSNSTPRDVKVMKQRCHILYQLLSGCVQRQDYSVLKPFLPPKQEYTIFVRLSEKQRKMYQHYIEEFVMESDSNIRGTPSLFSDYHCLARICSHPWSLHLERLKQIERNKYKDDSMDEFLDDEDDDKTSDSEEEEEEDSKKKSKKTVWNVDTSSDEEENAKARRKDRRKTTNNNSSDDSSSEDEVVRPTRSNKRSTRTAAKAKKESSNDSNDEKDIKEEKNMLPLQRGSLRSGINFKDGSENPEREEEKPEYEEEWYDKFITEEDEEKIELSGKLVLLLEILANAEVVGDKVLVFSQSLVSLDIIETALTGGKIGDDKVNWCHGVDYFRMDGSTPVQRRQRWSDIFNDPDNETCRLFLISTKAGSLGINMIAANRVVIFDCSWNPSHDLQSVFRVYRFGQEKPVYVYRFISQGAMEEKVYNRQITKLATAGRVVDEQQIERHFTDEEIRELYTFAPEDIKDAVTPQLPKDPLLAEVLQRQHPEFVVRYHEHDLLLESVESEELTEEERQQAWQNYENEKEMAVRRLNYQNNINQGIPPPDIQYHTGQAPYPTNEVQGTQSTVIQSTGQPKQFRIQLPKDLPREKLNEYISQQTRIFFAQKLAARERFLREQQERYERERFGIRNSHPQPNSYTREPSITAYHRQPPPTMNPRNPHSQDIRELPPIYQRIRFLNQSQQQQQQQIRNQENAAFFGKFQVRPNQK